MPSWREPTKEDYILPSREESFNKNRENESMNTIDYYIDLFNEYKLNITILLLLTLSILLNFYTINRINIQDNLLKKQTKLWKEQTNSLNKQTNLWKEQTNLLKVIYMKNKIIVHKKKK